MNEITCPFREPPYRRRRREGATPTVLGRGVRTSCEAMHGVPQRERVWLHSAVNLPAEFSDGKTLTLHASKAGELQNAQHRANRTDRYMFVSSSPAFCREDFMNQDLEADRSSMRGEGAQNA